MLNEDWPLLAWNLSEAASNKTYSVSIGTVAIEEDTFLTLPDYANGRIVVITETREINPARYSVIERPPFSQVFSDCLFTS